MAGLFHEKPCGVLVGQLAFHDEMLKSSKEKAKAGQEMSTVVLGVMVVGLVAYSGAARGVLQEGGAMAPHAIFATWLVILCGASGTAWVMASLLFSMSAQSGPDIDQPITYADFEKGRTVSDTPDAWPTMPEGEFYRTLAESHTHAPQSREAGPDRTSTGAYRPQAALFVGLAVAGIGAVAALVSLGPWA